MTALLGSWDAGFTAIPTPPIAGPHTNKSDPVTKPARILPTVGDAPTMPLLRGKGMMLNAVMRFRINERRMLETIHEGTKRQRKAGTMPTVQT